MARIGILTCSNATQELGCSSASCLADLRKRKGAFADYPADKPLDLVGIINCPGCPTLTGPDKLLQRIRGLTDFRVDAIHFSYCVKALCPFKETIREGITRGVSGDQDSRRHPPGAYHPGGIPGKGEKAFLPAAEDDGRYDTE